MHYCLHTGGCYLSGFCKANNTKMHVWIWLWKAKIIISTSNCQIKNWPKNLHVCLSVFLFIYIWSFSFSHCLSFSAHLSLYMCVSLSGYLYLSLTFFWACNRRYCNTSLLTSTWTMWFVCLVLRNVIHFILIESHPLVSKI